METSFRPFPADKFYQQEESSRVLTKGHAMPPIPADQRSPHGPCAPEKDRGRDDRDDARRMIRQRLPPTRYGASSDAEDDRYLNSRQVRERFGNCSDMWLWRRLRDGSGFPQPLEISGRRFWLLADLVDWERNCRGQL
jgi:predicted DNA-binding transcriptional regulator AlpA